MLSYRLKETFTSFFLLTQHYLPVDDCQLSKHVGVTIKSDAFKNKFCKMNNFYLTIKIFT